MAIVKRGCISSLWCQKSNLEIVITMPRWVSKQLGDSVTYRTIKAVIYGDIQNVQQFENSWLRFRQSQKPDKFFFIIFKEVRLSGMAKTMPQGTLYSPMPPPHKKKRYSALQCAWHWLTWPQYCCLQLYSPFRFSPCNIARLLGNHSGVRFRVKHPSVEPCWHKTVRL